MMFVSSKTIVNFIKRFNEEYFSDNKMFLVYNISCKVDNLE